MALEARIDRKDIEKIILEENEDGVWVLVYAPGQSFPIRDICQDNWDVAFLDVLEDFGVTKTMFVEIPNDRRMHY